MGPQSKRTTAETAGRDDAVKSFIDDLQAEPSGDHVLHGMVKPADTTEGLMFALPGNCEHWIYLPGAAMQTVRRTGRITCKGHFHATAEIELKAPQSDLEKTLADVVSLHQSNLLRLHGDLPSGAQLNAAVCPPGTSWKQDQWGNWGCWP
jgi:hypothetical protein